MIRARITAQLGDWKRRLRCIRSCIDRAPNDFWMHAALAGVYIEMGREDVPQCKVMRINPKFSLEWYGKRTLLKDRTIVNAFIEALRKAGPAGQGSWVAQP